MTDLDPHVAKVMLNDHLPEGETHICPQCGYAFGGEMQGMPEPEPEEADPLQTLAEALRMKGY